MRAMSLWQDGASNTFSKAQIPDRRGPADQQAARETAETMS